MPTKRGSPPGDPVKSGTLADRLAAAKPIVYRGRGDLLQVPWQPGCQGLALCFDLWTGYVGLLFGLPTLGFRAIALCTEMDEEARLACQANSPDSVHVPFR